jgi:hypothetical protein
VGAAYGEDRPVTLPPLLLDFALRQRRLTRYGAFCAEYKKTARALDPELAQEVPSRAQLHRWVTGGLKRLPYTDHCRVLEAMFPEWSVEQLFAPCPPEVLAADRPPAATDADRADLESRADRDGIAGFADVTAVYPTRAEFTFAMPPHTLFDGAQDIRMAGLSLNLLCQQYPDNRLHRLVESGTTLHCLFLNPEGEAIQAREREEGYRDRHLTTLTRLNIETITRLRDRLRPGPRPTHSRHV